LIESLKYTFLPIIRNLQPKGEILSLFFAAFLACNFSFGAETKLCSFIKHSEIKIYTLSSITPKTFNLYNSDTIKTLPDSSVADSNYLPQASSAVKSIVKYSAKDSIVYFEESKNVKLYSDAKVEYEDLTMNSANISIDLSKNNITSTGTLDTSGNLIGTPVFKQGSNEYKAKEITYSFETKRGFLKEFKTKEGEGYVKAESVLRDEANNFYNRYSYYTTCDEEVPHYYILANKLKVIPGKKVITGPANLVIEGVRTPLFVPFGIFPLKHGQQSGIIIPAYGFSTGRGYNLRNGGYYMGLGEHYDLTVLGDIYTNLSWGLNSRFNYSKRYRFNGSTNIQYYINKQGNPEDPGYNEVKNFSLQWYHRMDPKARPNTNFSADVNLVSSQYYALNSYNNSQAFNNIAVSGVNFSKSMKQGKYNFSSNARVSQNTQTRDLTLILPDLTFNVSSFQPFKSRKKVVADKWYDRISMSYSGTFQNLINTKDSIIFKNRDLAGWSKYIDTAFRYGARHAIPVQTSVNLFKYYTLSFGADYSESWNMSTIRRNWVDTGSFRGEMIDKVAGFARVYQFSARSGLSTRIYGQKNFAKGKIAAVRHVMNPSMDFVFMPDFSDPSWGFYKTVQSDTAGHTRKYSIFERAMFGGPGIGKQGNIGFSLDNNFEIKLRKNQDTAQKEEKVKIFESLRIGGAYNIFADSLKLSNISISARTTLFKSVSINGSAQLDPYVNVTSKNVNGYSTITRINKFAFLENHSIGKIISANTGLTFSLLPEMFKRIEGHATDRQLELREKGYNEFDIPWNVAISYTINYNAYAKIYNPNASNYIQNLIFNGSVTPTKNWSFGYQSGYDFIQKRISQLSVDLKRDLHCWQFTFNWMPIAPYGYQYFMFQINVKSNVLKDLKIPKRKDWFDERKI